MDFEKPIDHPDDLDEAGELGPGDWEDDQSESKSVVPIEIQEQQHVLSAKLESCKTARGILDIIRDEEKIYTVEGQLADKDSIIDVVFSLRTLLEFKRGKIASSLEIEEIEKILSRPEVDAILGLHDSLIRIVSETR